MVGTKANDGRASAVGLDNVPASGDLAQPSCEFDGEENSDQRLRFGHWELVLLEDQVRMAKP